MRAALTPTLTGPEWRDILLVLGAFWLPPTGVYLAWVWRSWYLFRRTERTYRAEGYPPPGPPTTDSLPADEIP